MSLQADNPSPLVSVIIPVYQGESLIRRAVYSALNQTHAHVEVLVVDNGSTDGTLDILGQIPDPRLKVLHQPEKGVSQARNLAMSQASGEYFAFLDTDDLWHPTYLTEALDVVGRYNTPECLVYNGYYAVNEAEQLVNMPPLHRHKGMVFDDVFATEGMLLPSTTVMHRKVYETIGGFPVDCYHEDRVYFILACMQFPAYPTQKRLVVYRQTLSGRCRSVLQHYDAALEAELSIVEVMQPVLSPTQTETLAQLQMRNLFYRFLMYDYFASAKQLYPQVNPALLHDKKGILARLSMGLGVNLLYLARCTVQLAYKTLCAPWWCGVRKPYFPKP